MSHLLQIGLIFLLGYGGALLANKVGLPKVSGYVIIGILLSPSIGGVITESFLNETTIIVDFSLAMVAYTLGGHLKLSGIKERGKEIFAITLGQGIGAYILVTLSSFVFMQYFYIEFSMLDIIIISLLFGAISLSTAPAATIATVHECKAKGCFTSVLLAVVALDDAMGLIFFAFTLSVIKSLVAGDGIGNVSFGWVLMKLGHSILIGGGVGLVLAKLIKIIQKRETIVVMTVAAFCLVFGLAESLGLEPLFATMILGLTVANLYPDNLPFKFLEGYYEPIIFVVFFVLAGAHIDLHILMEYFPLALLFVTFRVSGKWIGAWTAGTIVTMPKTHMRYMGLALSPQAGIAIGLALYVQQIPSLEVYGTIALNVIVAKTAINEIIGPWLLKRVLYKVGEANQT